jgi:glucose/arabinose dehydrogenase
MGITRLAAVWAACTLILSACGGSSGSGGGLAPPAPPPPPPPPTAEPSIAVQAVYPNLSFSQPVSLQQAPGDSTIWYVVEQAGRILTFANDQSANAAVPFLDITDRVASGGERGLLGIALHPFFPTVEDVYVSYTALNVNDDLFSILSRFALLPDGSGLNPASEEPVLVVPQDFGNHNGGNIAFGPDGYLYLGLGDGGSGNDPNDRAQTTTNLLGAMVRVDIDTGSPYAVPPDNPFSANQTCPLGFTVGGEDCPEIFAWGLRNPWRFSFDRQTGQLWVGDVGQGAWEEVDRISAGDNLGWRVREGAHCNIPLTGCSTNFVEPVTEYDHSLGASITGGFVYRGSAIPDLVGWYVFGDFISGRIFAVPADSPIGVTPTMLLESGLSIASFAEDNDGELYVVDYGGSIRQITNAP